MQTTINIGKQGLTQTALDEIKRQLKTHGEVKVKFLQSAPDRKKSVSGLAELVGARTKSKVGFVVVLQKK